ncbi:DUF421 domain-containing protein [Noviherbaspirillum sp. CPCC 100848]|uniref:DUF421 domain-containing protein n=1 Tax=Noviherbaspirillum album TaxID=3080276 RepID=A0ABU6JHN0_9BURK|nr:YetF domain-containing protein [Noviherbaspirillum sp. CPCC 100848]MEC4723173.1 DUF421 domain-containing protein [Noviherbaspirillum sp. CPCC 100848]
MFFESWNNLSRVILIGSLAYAGLIVLLRISGNRTLSKMNSFDLVVTVAFGSTLSTILVNRNITLAEGLTAVALLVALQYAITWLSVRSAQFSGIIKTTPTLLVKDGRLLDDALKKVRVTKDEIHAAIRQNGMGSVDQVGAIIMETDGSLSVISQRNAGDLSVLEGVNGISDR